MTNKQYSITVLQTIILAIVFLFPLSCGIILFDQYPILDRKDLNNALLYVIIFPLAYIMVRITLKLLKKKYVLNLVRPKLNLMILVVIIVFLLITCFYFPINYLTLSKQALKSIIGKPDIPIDNITEGLIFAPIFEELVFRGIILKGLLNKYNVKKAIIISAFLFAIPHFSPIDLMKFPTTLIDGLFLGWIFYKTNSVITTILMHFTYNITIITVCYYFASVNTIVFQETSIQYLYGEYTYIILPVLFISLILAIYYLYHYFKKYDTIQESDLVQ